MPNLANELQSAYDAHRAASPEDLKQLHDQLGSLLYGHIPAIIEALRAREWRSLKDDPPTEGHNRGFWVGHSEGGRMDYVWTWPHPKTGKMAYWCTGGNGNYLLDDYGPDVWCAGPPWIPGSDIAYLRRQDPPKN